MGKFGFGYGSEWQLLRMLGRHRNYFDVLVKESINLKQLCLDSYDIKWYDFKFKGSQDTEWLGSDLFNHLDLTHNHPKILAKTNWDLIGKVDYIYLLGEAKGYITEFEKESDSTKAKINSLTEYKKLLEEVFAHYKISDTYTDVWLNVGFQLGNRISMNYYLKRFNITSKVMYVFFLNAWMYSYDKGDLENKHNVDSKKAWIDSFDRMIEKLGFVTEDQKNQVFEEIVMVYPNCN